MKQKGFGSFARSKFKGLLYNLASLFKFSFTLLFLLVLTAGMDKLMHDEASSFCGTHWDMELSEGDTEEKEDKVGEKEKDEEEQVLLHAVTNVTHHADALNNAANPRLYLFGTNHSLLRPPTIA